MFPAAHCCNPGSYAGSTSAGYSKEPLLRKGQRHGGHPDKSDLARRALVCKGKHLRHSSSLKESSSICLFMALQSMAFFRLTVS